MRWPAREALLNLSHCGANAGPTTPQPVELPVPELGLPGAVGPQEAAAAADNRREPRARCQQRSSLR
eukprot:2810004-Lingulodinium_polyedra.AAC.1